MAVRRTHSSVGIAVSTFASDKTHTTCIFSDSALPVAYWINVYQWVGWISAETVASNGHVKFFS
jgi:hypothetical protein